MSISDLKSKIIDKVHSIESEDVLSEIYDLIAIEARIDSVYHVTELERSAIEVGLDDIRNGKVMSSEKANTLMREWLKK